MSVVDVAALHQRLLLLDRENMDSHRREIFRGGCRIGHR
jgi:hypothetical protein